MGKLNLKYGILTFGLVAVATASVMPGCSADGVTGGTDEDSGTVIDATTGGGEDATIDSTTSSSGGQDAAKDAPSDAKKDVTVVDSGSDAAKDASSDASDGGGAPAPGSACPTPGVTFQRTCGFCGKQEAVCEGTNLVSAYGPCSGEVANGCLPGSTRQTACGLCGTKSEICQNNCQWSSGLCGGEPMNACAPGSVQYTTGGCSEPNTFRKQTCSAQCQYGAPAPLPCLPKDGDITISNAVGGIVSGEFDLSPLNDQIPRIYSGACPQTFSPSSSSYKYVIVKNPTAQTATVEIWFDAPAGKSDLDTVVTYYPGSNEPIGTAARGACTGSVNDFCSTAPCTGSWSGLVGANAAIIPPNSTIVVYHAAYSSSVTGSFAMFTKTTALQ